MWDLLYFALNSLEIKDQITKKTQKKILSTRNNKTLVQQLTIEFDQEARLNNCTQCPNRHFHNFFLACLYNELGTIVQTQYHIKKAIKDFNRMGSKWNEMLASWVYGETLLELKREMPAHRVFENTIVMLEEMERTFRHHDQYEEQQKCLAYIERIRASLSREAERDTQAPKQPSPPPPQNGSQKSKLKHLWKRSQLVFPVHSQLQAGIQGAFIFESQTEPDAMLDELSFNQIIHYLYNIQEEGDPIVLGPQSYRWFQVKGDSMNQASPVPIVENDYILALDIYMTAKQVQYGDIVIASLHNPSQNERVGVIKKYTKTGLESLSKTDYPPIAENKASIRGIAIAVAKPINKQLEHKKTEKTESDYVYTDLESEVNYENTQRLYNRLRTLVSNDEETANRLIEYERNRNSKATMEELIQDAIERLSRDRK